MGNNKYKILIVEDEANIRSFIKANLETSDYQVLCAETCALGIMMYASHRPDLIVLDLGLPDRDGLDLIQKVRESDTVPIIVLSARSNERDKVEALDLGANDYITKPFGTEELLARIRAVLRSHRHSEEKESSHGGKFRLQDLLIDYDTRQVFVGKEEIDLTQTEYNIMAFLSVHAGKVLTYAAIIRAVWGYSDYGSVPVIVMNRNSQQDVLHDAIEMQRTLEIHAKDAYEKGGSYIRPIVLFQAQPKSTENATTFEKLRQRLIAANIPAEQIAIKTAEINELKNVDLLSEKCSIRFIITVNALKEGWDCPFAYILASLANRTSQVDVEHTIASAVKVSTSAYR